MNGRRSHDQRNEELALCSEISPELYEGSKDLFEGSLGRCFSIQRSQAKLDIQVGEGNTGRFEELAPQSGDERTGPQDA